MSKKSSEVWRRNEDGSITFKILKTASTTLIEDDKVALQVTFQHKPSDDPDFKPEAVQLVMPVKAAEELAGYLHHFVEVSQDRAEATLPAPTTDAPPTVH